MAHDGAVAELLTRITSLEAARAVAQTVASQNAARAALAEDRLAAAEREQADAERRAAAAQARLRWWQRTGGSSGGYRQLGERVEQLLRLAEEQAAEVVAAAGADAQQIRSAAVSDAARIRQSALGGGSPGWDG